MLCYSAVGQVKLLGEIKCNRRVSVDDVDVLCTSLSLSKEVYLDASAADFNGVRCA
jgi:hypothetical protein